MTPEQKTIAITGGTSGLGLATVEALAKENWRIVLLARNREKAESLTRRFGKEQIDHVHCDFTDLSSVASAANSLNKNYSSIDVLMNNAGGVVKGYQTTKDGFEKTFQINHLGHFLLTKKLVPKLSDQIESRVINISSSAHFYAKFRLDDFDVRGTYNPYRAYANGKLFNILMARKMHELYSNNGIQCFSLHPGIVATNIAQDYSFLVKLIFLCGRPFMLSAPDGASTQLYLATAPSQTLSPHGGDYFVRSKPSRVSRHARDETLRSRLWDVSTEMVQAYL